jgi:1-acyl-sn-glycerol-3-phosphate acyltransferase
MSGPRAGCLTRLRRGLYLVGHLVKGLVLVSVVFPRIRPVERDRLIEQWSRGALDILSVRLSLHGDTPPANVSSILFVANHVSWLDILVINACRRVRFVAKTEVRRWPVIGWLAARTGTIFFRRASPRELARAAKRMTAFLRRGHCVTFFPEGTTTDGTSVKTFHSGLFESALQAEALIWPIAIQYLRPDGVRDREIAFVGDQSLVSSIAGILGRPATDARLVFTSPIESATGDRRFLASRCREVIEQSLVGTPLADRPSRRPLQAQPG